ncbi:MAG TPA: hypothetical protein VF618_26590 [Thermoanaerobaculia bacterium]
MLSLRAFFSIVIFSTACAASQPAAPATPWRVELTTSGGITGRGTGNVTVHSDRKLELTNMAGKSCTFEATEEELATFTRLVGAARPDKWEASYAPENECCDRIEWTLTLDEAGKVGKTRWIDDPGKPLPADVEALAAAFRKARETYHSQCR